MGVRGGNRGGDGSRGRVEPEQLRLQVQPARESPQHGLVQELRAARVHAVEDGAGRALLPPPPARPRTPARLAARRAHAWLG